MDGWNSLQKPESLEEGKRYLRMQNGRDKPYPKVQLVTFRGYTACPAVVVQAGENSRVRCAREELRVVPVQ
jgi:hypothetical protein